MKNKEYYTKEFRNLQSEWYDKLKKEGFEDIEWYNPKTGIGHGSRFLKSKNIPDTGNIVRNYSPDVENLYRLCRNFLAHGPFYSKFQDIYANSDELKRNFKSLRGFINSIDFVYSRAETECFRLHSEGASLREISKELRRLHRRKKLGKPPKRWGVATKGEPYSIYWVSHKVRDLRSDMRLFNGSDEEGLNAEKDATAIKNSDNIFDGFDISANRV